MKNIFPEIKGEANTRQQPGFMLTKNQWKKAMSLKSQVGSDSRHWVKCGHKPTMGGCQRKADREEFRSCERPAFDL